MPMTEGIVSECSTGHLKTGMQLNLKYVSRSPETHPVACLRWTESVNNHLTDLTTHQPVWLVCTEIAHPRQMTHKHHVFLFQHRRTLHRWRCNFLKCKHYSHSVDASMHHFHPQPAAGNLKRSSNTQSGRFIIVWHHTLHYSVHVTRNNYFSKNVHLQTSTYNKNTIIKHDCIGHGIIYSYKLASI